MYTTLSLTAEKAEITPNGSKFISVEIDTVDTDEILNQIDENVIMDFLGEEKVKSYFNLKDND
jgi:hypothetical protein